MVRRTRWSSFGALREPLGILVGTWLTMTFATAYEIVPASFLPVLRDELVVGAVAGSLVISSVYLVQVVVGLPIGVGLDRIDNKTAITVASVTLVIAGLWGWHASVYVHYWSLIGSRLLGGVSYMVMWAGSANVVAGAFSSERRAIAVSLMASSPMVGFAVAQATGPVLTAHLGWESNFVAFPVLALLGLVIYRTSGQSPESVDGTGSSPTFADFKHVVSDRRVWIVCAIAFMGNSIALFFNSWMPTYMTTRFGLSLTQSGLFVAAFPAVGAVSRVSGGYVSDRFLGRRRRPIVLVSFVAILPLLVAVASLRSLWTIVIVLTAMGYVIQTGLGLVFVYVQELVEANVSGTAVALVSSMAIFGASSSPLIGGSLITATGSFTTSFVYLGVLAIAGLGFSWYAPEPHR